MDTDDSNFHVVFLPFFATSHIVPLAHVARLFAARGVRSTIVTTVHNAAIFQSSVDRDAADGHPVSVKTMEFPASRVGLPVGVENTSSASSTATAGLVFHGMMMLRPTMEQVIRDLAPDCIFSDKFFPWTAVLAEELKIPRLMFYPESFLYHSMFRSFKTHAPHANVESESESFVVPGLPDKITVKRSQMPEHLITKTGFGDLYDTFHQSEGKSFGLVHNTFYELEPAYADHIEKIKGRKSFHIGPLFQFFNKVDSKGGGTSEKHPCVSWLDSQNPKSVIYVCFGSMANFPPAQINEIALALEECKQPFIWVVRSSGDEGIEGLTKEIEERITRENKGFIITGWAPQVKILNHPALGGFMTHCGWNSVLEAVVAGVPMLTWPLTAEHFFNEKLVEVLGIGVAVGAEVWNPSFDIVSPIIEKGNIIEAVRKLTDDLVISESVRTIIKELSLKAKQAVQEGGSSFNNLAQLIEDIKAFKFTPN